MLSTKIVSLLLGVLPFATGHYQYPIFVNKGVASKPWEFTRRPNGHPKERPPSDRPYYLSPLFDPMNPEVICGLDTMQNAKDTGVAKVQAGTQVGFQLFEGETIYHDGPLITWLGKAPGDVRDYDGTADNWFIIDKTGLRWNADATSGYERIKWPILGAKNYTVTIPQTTPPGQYLLRFEHIQPSQTFNTSQRFVNCAQIEIEGPGGGIPSPLYRILNPKFLFDRGSWLPNILYGNPSVTEADAKAYVAPYGPVWRG